MPQELTRQRRVNPEDIVALLKGTPPPMPSGVTPPVVTPVVQPVAGAPTVGAIPDAKRQKILEMIKGATANQPLTTTPPDPGAAIQERVLEPLNQGEIQRPNDPRFSQGKVFESGYAAPNDPTDVTGEAQSRAAIKGKGAGAGRIQTMIDHPTRDVNPDGSAGTVNRMSKKKAFLLGLLKGISTEGEKQGGHTWGSIIGGGGAGAAIGAIHPRSIQEWQRRDDVATEQGLLNNQQKLGQQQANIEETQAQAKQRAEMPAIEAAKAIEQAKQNAEQNRLRQQVIDGTKTATEAKAAFEKYKLEQAAEQKEKDRENDRVIAGMPARSRPGADTGSKRQAKLKEFEDVKANAEILEGNADTNEQLANAEPKDPLGEETPRAKEFRKKAEDFRKDAQGLRAKLPGLKSDADSIPAPTAEAAAGKPAPASHSFSVSAYLSRNKGATKADALAFAKQKYPGFEVID